MIEIESTMLTWSRLAAVRCRCSSRCYFETLAGPLARISWSKNQTKQEADSEDDPVRLQSHPTCMRTMFTCHDAMRAGEDTLPRAFKKKNFWPDCCFLSRRQPPQRASSLQKLLIKCRGKRRLFKCAFSTAWKDIKTSAPAESPLWFLTSTCTLETSGLSDCAAATTTTTST